MGYDLQVRVKRPLRIRAARQCYLQSCTIEAEPAEMLEAKWTDESA
jgi:hypothetical protein